MCQLPKGGVSHLPGGLLAKILRFHHCSPRSIPGQGKLKSSDLLSHHIKRFFFCYYHNKALMSWTHTVSKYLLVYFFFLSLLLLAKWLRKKHTHMNSSICTASCQHLAVTYWSSHLDRPRRLTDMSAFSLAAVDFLSTGL